MLDIIKAIRSMSLLEKTDMSEQFIRDVLDCRRVPMTIVDALSINNMQTAIALMDRYPDVSFALVDAIESVLGNSIQQINELRRRPILTPAGTVQPVGHENTIQKIEAAKSISDKYLQALELLKFFCRELPFEHSNASIGYLCACMCLDVPFCLDNEGLAHSAVDAAVMGDMSVFDNILRSIETSSDTIEYNGKVYKVADIVASVPRSIRAMFETDYDCARQYVSQYAAQVVL